MSPPFNKSERVNLSTAEVLLACGDPEGLNILAEMFAGFGVHTPRRCLSSMEGRASVQERIFNLLVRGSLTYVIGDAAFGVRLPGRPYLAVRVRKANRSA